MVLAGYSYGGDDLPLIAQALPAQVLAQVRLLVLISPAAQGDMTFRGYSWFDLSTSAAMPLAPALAKLAGVPILCIHSARDPRQACDQLKVPGMDPRPGPGRPPLCGSRGRDGRPGAQGRPGRRRRSVMRQTLHRRGHNTQDGHQHA